MSKKIEAKPPPPTFHIVDGRTVMLQGEVGYVELAPGCHYAVHLPTAALALVRPLDVPKQAAS